MRFQLPYGKSKSIDIDLPDGRVLARVDGPHAHLNDPRESLRGALAAPLDFAPLAQAVVPGDHVVLAVENGMPQAAEAAAAVIDVLTSSGVERDDVVVLLAGSSDDAHDAYQSERLAEDLRSQLSGAVQVELHAPADRDQLGYLGVAPDDSPLYVHRALCDADVIVPIGMARCEPGGLATANGSKAAARGAFPGDTLLARFTDEQTLARLRKARSRAGDANAEASARRYETEVARLLPAPLAVRVVPGRSSELLNVFAGHPISIARQANEASQQAWSAEVPVAQTVVATLEGDRIQQSWDNLGLALRAVATIVADDGALILCTELAEPPGDGVSLLARTEDIDTALRTILQTRPRDWRAASELARMLERAKVYLLSQLDAAQVEELGMTYLATEDEVRRLVRASESCVVVHGAQFARLTPAPR